MIFQLLHNTTNQLLINYSEKETKIQNRNLANRKSKEGYKEVDHVVDYDYEGIINKSKQLELRSTSIADDDVLE